MLFARAPRLRLAIVVSAITLVSLALSQWLGARAWDREVQGLYAWRNAVKAAPPGTVVPLLYRPALIAFRSAEASPRGYDEVLLEFRPGAFAWLSRLGPEDLRDSALISIIHENGRLLPEVHHGSD